MADVLLYRLRLPPPAGSGLNVPLTGVPLGAGKTAGPEVNLVVTDVILTPPFQVAVASVQEMANGWLDAGPFTVKLTSLWYE